MSEWMRFHLVGTTARFRLLSLNSATYMKIEGGDGGNKATYKILVASWCIILKETG